MEELEALRELADELEESHIETEKQLQEEIGASNLSLSLCCAAQLIDSYLLRTDLKDLLIQDLRKRNDSLEDSCVDFERTISQFRDVVVSLQRCVSSS